MITFFGQGFISNPLACITQGYFYGLSQAMPTPFPKNANHSRRSQIDGFVQQDNLPTSIYYQVDKKVLQSY